MTNTSKKLSSVHSLFIYLLFFLSGFIALIYEVLWMKELGLLFGNTAHAAATVLTAFFCGLGVGSFYWGKRAATINNPLRAYGYLELAVAVSAIGYFAILYAYRAIYPNLFEFFSGHPDLFLIAKFLLSLILLFPPALFMGGTLPVMSQYLVRQKARMGQSVSALYAINTLGAASGTLAAGFVLPRFLGFDLSFAVAMALNLLVGVGAIAMARRYNRPGHDESGSQQQLAKQTIANITVPAYVAFISGSVTLALQVLWIRMFSQVLNNSVYTFSSILTVFLLLLALGAVLANQLMRLRINTTLCLIVLLTLSGALIISSTFLFTAITDGMAYVKGAQGWVHYISKVFGLILLVIGPALLCLGTILPLTFKLVENNGQSVGRLVGVLTSINTLGAVVGSLLAGFILLETVGLWQAIRVVACLYLMAAVILAFSQYLDVTRWAAAPVTAFLLTAVFLDLSAMPTVNLDSEGKEEKLIELWEGSAGTVAVTHTPSLGGLRVKVNNHYNLGGSGAAVLEELQTDIAMQIHPNPQHVYVLGLGSGITAGAALKYPLEKLTVTELVPDVITASRKHFAPYLHGLFTDPRAKVIAEDGRNYLEGSREQYDVIIADLFVPWRAGVGYLYTKEHFQAVARRLEDDGLFMQWLPSHQITEEQFNIIAHTFLSVFPQVTMWRADFMQDVSLIGLLGRKQTRPFPEANAEKALRVAGLEIKNLPLLSHYMGNLGIQKHLFDDAIMNVDDYPVILYNSPIAEQLKLAGKVDFLSGMDFYKLVTRLRKKVPTAKDPYLEKLTADEKQWVEIGYSLHRIEALRVGGRRSAAVKEYYQFDAMLKKWKNLRGSKDPP